MKGTLYPEYIKKIIPAIPKTVLLFTPFTVTYTSLNDRNRMIGIVINRKQEYNISVKQYLSESNNLNGDKKWITENSANAIT